MSVSSTIEAAVRVETKRQPLPPRERLEQIFDIRDLDAIYGTKPALKNIASLHVDAASVFAHDAGLRCEMNARTLLAAMSTGDTLRTSLAALRRLLKVASINTVAARRRIATAIRDKKAYPFSQ